jgi:MmyB-like transcription regulator ligand binding domain
MPREPVGPRRPDSRMIGVAGEHYVAALVGDLSIRDEQFRQWWAGTHVAVKRRGTRTYNHPAVGEITLDWDPLTSDADPDQQLIIYTAAPGSRSEQALRELAAWAADNIGTSG